MLSPQLRQKVFNLWTTFWSSGMTNPLTAIEQITYLLFLKQLESVDNERVKNGRPSLYGVRPDCRLPHPDSPAECSGHDVCRWSTIKRDPTHDLLSQYVFPWLRELDRTLSVLSNGGADDLPGVGRGIMDDAYFQFPREKAATLQTAIHTIDTLFPEGDSQSSDLMGGIFEYLLSEIQTSGKNGQFRTPRHIIRFMVELLDPNPADWTGQGVIDPAAGTGGFLFSTIQHLLKRVTPPEELRLEADGTPHRLLGGDLAVEPFITGKYFTGYDNDRTMVRIGWMNLVLHGIENPRFERRDTLSKSFQERAAYDVVLANPPFTGNVDKGDLHESRFPRNPRRSADPITTKSELLFVWLMLDLLRPGGRAAVIVPEGVLFGATGAHKELRRQLLFEHELQAVVSLPAGAFQPYTGVKTSILLFQKVGHQPRPGQPPRTSGVWFYEVLADGYSLDARRNPQPEPNDLWDALAKWPGRVEESLDYHRPELYSERWRVVDEETCKRFADLAGEQGKVWGIHELFPELPAGPQAAEEQIKAAQTPAIRDLYRRHLLAQLAAQARAALLPLDAEQAEAIAAQSRRELRRGFNEAIRYWLDGEFEQFGLKALKASLDQVEAELQAGLADLLAQAVEQAQEDPEGERAPDPDGAASAEAVVREFAKLDGFDVRLRSVAVQREENALDESRCWLAPLRAYARDDEWQGQDGAQGSHDETGQVRLEYLAYLRQAGVFDENGAVKAEHLDLLDPDCIEANDLNLSAGRYKPFVLETEKYDPPADILRAVRELEQQLVAGIDNLLEMVEGAE